MKNWSFSSSILLTCNSVWQRTFSGWTFFQLFPQIWNQRKILRILNTHMPKNNQKNFGVIEYIYEYLLELVECKFARNCLANWKTFLTDIFENIFWHLFCWWISSSCENHCNLIGMSRQQRNMNAVSMWLFPLKPFSFCLWKTWTREIF